VVAWCGGSVQVSATHPRRGFRRDRRGAGLTLLEDDLIGTSRDPGAAKPNARIYEFAAERAQISIGSSLYIGEDPSDVTGAQVAGMGGLIKP
jgi:FMN phosphatase YigB (HAD superfamily)